MVPDRIEREILIGAPREVVWAIVTEPKHVGGWFSDSVEIDLRPGGAAVFTWDEHGARRARVEEVDAPSTFSFRWAHAADAEPTAGASTLVEFHLSEDGEGTRLRVIETGFQELEGPEEDGARHAAENTEGWEFELGQLRDYVAEQVGRTAAS